MRQRRPHRNHIALGYVGKTMLRPLLASSVAVLALAGSSSAGAAPPTGFTPPQTLGPGLQVSGAIVAADAAGGQPAAVAFADRSGQVWAARVRADGSLGSPLPAGSSQADVRDVQVAVTDRGELVVVWAALVNRSNGGSAVRYAVAAPGRSFSGARTLAAVGSNTGATLRRPRAARARGQRRAGVGAGRRAESGERLRRGRLQPDLADARVAADTPLVLFTRQIASTSGVQAQAVAADPATGDATLLADAGSIATPAVAGSGDSVLVAWAAQAGGIAVSIDH